jgi:DNA-binding NtrC family response regulator
MKHRVLLVDDDAAIRDTFAHHLGRADFSIATADSAESALTMIADVDPDVVVTDVRMPGMNGLELVRLLRERIPGLNVVVITAYEDMETAVGAMRAGAFDYLVKPLDLDQISWSSSARAVIGAFGNESTAPPRMRAVDRASTDWPGAIPE